MKTLASLTNVFDLFPLAVGLTFTDASDEIVLKRLNLVLAVMPPPTLRLADCAAEYSTT